MKKRYVIHFTGVFENGYVRNVWIKKTNQITILITPDDILNFATTYRYKWIAKIFCYIYNVSENARFGFRIYRIQTITEITLTARDGNPKIMSSLIEISLCLDNIPAEKKSKGKNGKTYVDVCVTKRKEPDTYGNTHNVYLKQSKEERNASKDKVYIGNAKEIIFKDNG